MLNEKESAAPYPSAATDGGQPSNKSYNINVADSAEEINTEMDLRLKIRQLNDPFYICTASMSEILGTVYDSKSAIIEGLLHPGVCIFAGPPKIGKSFFMAQVAYHVATGLPLWDKYPVQQGSVLYLALEDTFSRIQSRIYRMFGSEETTNLHFAVSIKQMGHGLTEQLEKFVETHPDTKLVIIDTLQRIREAGSERYSYASDYEVIQMLKQFADRYGISVVCVHHTRKQPAEDGFCMISGTNGLMGAADGAILMQKAIRTGDEATLDISARDLPDQRLYLKRDAERLVWHLERVENEPWKEPPDPILESVADLVRHSDTGWAGTPSELVIALGIEIKPNKLTMHLNVRASRLEEEHAVKYEHRRTHDGRRIVLKSTE